MDKYYFCAHFDVIFQNISYMVADNDLIYDTKHMFVKFVSIVIFNYKTQYTLRYMIFQIQFKKDICVELKYKIRKTIIT